MALQPSTRLAPYEIVSLVGAGGMEEVYRARDTRLDRTVAAKVLPTHVAGSPELRQRLEREARAVSSLNHPHICTLYDVGREDGLDFLVMEYLEGETLASKLAQGPLATEELLRCAIQITEALDHAHRRGVHHRDLKPSNIMLTRTGASSRGRIPQQNQVLSAGAHDGFPGYVAVEGHQPAAFSHHQSQ